MRQTISIFPHHYPSHRSHCVVIIITIALIYRYISTQLSIIILLPIIIIHPTYFFVDIIVAFIIINQNSCKFDLLSVIQQLYPLFIKFSIFNNASLARRFQNITIKCSLIGTIDEFQSKRCFSKYFATFIFKREIFC